MGDGRRVELFWKAPQASGPWAAILYVHGHQSRGRPGGRVYVDNSALDGAAAMGLFAAAVSQPGYGASDGPPDFCGAASQAAVAAALDWLRARPQVRSSRVALYGYSRGAITASMVATRDSSLAGLIIGGGAYDLEDMYRRLDNSSKNAGLKENFDTEAGATVEAFRRRSALLAREPIRVPTLILHGELDRTSPVSQARRLAEQIRRTGAPVELLVFAGVGHGIPPEQRKDPIERFLRRFVLTGEKQ